MAYRVLLCLHVRFEHDLQELAALQNVGDGSRCGWGIGLLRQLHNCLVQQVRLLSRHTNQGQGAGASAAAAKWGTRQAGAAPDL